MSVNNCALLFIGYPVRELDQFFKPGSDIEEQWEKIKEEVHYRKLGTKIDIKHGEIDIQWSTAHMEYLVGVMIANSGSYSFQTLVAKDLFENVILLENALKLIFLKDPTLYIMNLQSYFGVVMMPEHPEHTPDSY